MSDPAHWTSVVSKAAWTLLAMTVVVFVAWQVLQRVWPALLIVAALLTVYRVVLGGRRRGGW